MEWFFSWLFPRITLSVRHKKGKNALPVEMKADKTVFDLAKYLQDNASLFGLQSSDIDPEELGIFIDDGTKKKRIDDLAMSVSKLRNRKIVFETPPRKEITVYVRHELSENALPLQCLRSDSVHDLVHIIRRKAKTLGLPDEVERQISGTDHDIKLYQKGTGTPRDIDLNRNINDVDIETTIVFKTVQRTRENITVYIRHESSKNALSLPCLRSYSGHDLVHIIRLNAKNFGLRDEVERQIEGTDHDIKLYQRGTGARRDIDLNRKLNDIDIATPIVFQTVQRDREITIDDLKGLCKGQRIAFFGAQGHGKSSLLNTIATAVSRTYTPLASTWTKEATGTSVISTFPFCIGDQYWNNSVIFVDVPGRGFEDKTTKGYDISKAIITAILNGKYPKDRPLDQLSTWWSWYQQWGSERIDPIDTAVFVHKADAEPDRLGKLLMAAATAEDRGRSIPVILVMTHIDKVSTSELADAQEKLSLRTGRDESGVLHIHNYARGDSISDKERRQKVLNMFYEILKVSSAQMGVPTTDQ